MRNYITLIKRAKYTRFGFITTTVDEALNIIQNGNYYLYDQEVGY